MLKIDDMDAKDLIIDDFSILQKEVKVKKTKGLNDSAF